jgi:hypothetical protein
MRPLALLLTATLIVAGCSEGSKTPTTPTTPSTPPTTTPPDPPPVSTAQLKLVWLCCGSNQVSLNTQRQVELWVTQLDGSIRDVTAWAKDWKSSKPNIASVSDKGIVRGLAVGDFDISASYQGILATWGLYVPENVYRPAGGDEITGTVREITINGEVEVWNAEVEIVGGPDSGRKTRTNTGGLFRFTGLQAAGFEVVIRDAGYSQKRFRVDQLGVDVSAETIVTPAPTMVSEVLEGPVCYPTRTVTKTFTPSNPGILRITSARYQSTLRDLYEDGVLIERSLSNNRDVPIRAGARYELRVTGSCDYNPGNDVRLTLLRPR